MRCENCPYFSDFGTCGCSIILRSNSETKPLLTKSGCKLKAKEADKLYRLLKESEDQTNHYLAFSDKITESGERRCRKEYCDYLRELRKRRTI